MRRVQDGRVVRKDSGCAGMSMHSMSLHSVFSKKAVMLLIKMSLQGLRSEANLEVP